MRKSWRFVVTLLLTHIVGSATFVVTVPLGKRFSGAALRSRPTSPSCLSASTGGRARCAPWACISPDKQTGGKKVAVTLPAPSPKPQVSTQKETQVKQQTRIKSVSKVAELPMADLLLIGEKDYNREHVVLAIQQILPKTDSTRAAQLFDEAQKTSKAICGRYPVEQAELYVQQFTQSDPLIYSYLVEDGKRLDAP